MQQERKGASSGDDVSALLKDIGSSGQDALDRLFPVLYRELKRIAHAPASR